MAILNKAEKCLIWSPFLSSNGEKLPKSALYCYFYILFEKSGSIPFRKMLGIADRIKIDDFGFFRTYFSSRNSRFFHTNQSIKAVKNSNKTFSSTFNNFIWRTHQNTFQKKLQITVSIRSKKIFFGRTIARIDKIRVFFENLKFNCKKRPQAGDVVHPHIFILKI